MNPAEIEDVVNRSVLKTLTALGVDASSPEAIVQAQVDFAYLRRSRRGAEEVAKWMKRTIVTAAVSGAGAMLWVGFADAIKRKLGG